VKKESTTAPATTLPPVSRTAPAVTRLSTPTVTAAPAPPADPFATARRAEHARRGETEEQCEALLAAIKVPREDGSGWTAPELQETGRGLGISELEVQAALDVLEGQGFVERSVAQEQLRWHPRQMSATQRIIVP
jgi:hypothetical protein